MLVVDVQWRTAKGERLTVIGLGGILCSGSAGRVLINVKRDVVMEKGKTDCDVVVVRRSGEKMVSLRKTTEGEMLCID
jgi:hypothetical protein